MAEDPTTMSSTTEEGFVKKLFFPAYTDAGFDESFHRATTIVMQKEKLETSLTESVVSEASTAIRDNRSHRTAASGSVDTTPARRFQNQKIPSTFAAAHHHHHQPPSFFASTKPAATATIVVHPQHAYLLPVPPSPASAAPRNMPVSPPKVARMPVTIRNVSTEAVINNTTRSQSKTEATTNSRFAFLDVDNDDDDDDSNGEASFKDASSIAIVRKTSQATYDVTEDALTYVRSGESSDGSSSISVALALPPVSMFDDTTETEVDPTSWEEEATPAETAFGKMLLFQRVLRSPDDDNHEDVLSTASQNGSIVDNDDTGCNDSEPNVVATNAWDDAVVQPNASAESGGGASLQSLYTTPPQEEYSDPVWDESDLSMPVLENAASVVAAARENDKKLPSRRGTTNHHGVDNEEEKEMEHHEAAVATTTTTTESRVIGTEDNKNNKSYTLGAQSNAASEVVKQQGATGMLSMAIRRLGSGLTGNSRQINNNSSKHFSSLSAPTTPRASSFNAPRSPPTDGAEATTPRSLALSLMSPLQKVVATAAAAAENDGTTTTTTGKSRNNLPSSFLLRSPGSAAFQAASKDSSGSYPHIPPRFTSWPGGSNQQQQQRRNMFSKIPEDEEGIRDDDNHNLIRPSVNNSNAFQIARSCFSFDAFDTSMDEQYEFTIPNNHYDTAATKQAPCLDSSSDLSRQLLTLDLNTTTTSWQPEPPIVNFSVAGSDQQQQHTRRTHINASTVELSTSPSQERNNHSPNRVLIGSASWDVGFAPQQQRAPAFRPRSERIRGNLSSILRPTKSVSSPRNNRVRSTSDFIPITLTAAAAAGNYDSETTQQLRSPERIELEREDALDILACLVERGVSWKQETVSSGDDADVGTGQQEDGDGAKEDSPKRQTQDLGSPSPSTSDIAAIVKELQDLSLAEEKLGDFYDNSEAHMKRKLALEELLRSHEYAVEMKRASLSASSWLKSIGRSQSSSPSKAGSPARNTIISETTTNDDLPSRTSTPKTETPDSSQQAAGEESSASENIDLLTAKAMLHTALMEAKEKSELADRLNEELVSCGWHFDKP